MIREYVGPNTLTPDAYDGSFQRDASVPLLTSSAQVVKLLLAAKAGTCHAGSFSQS